jgi:hypothetical protein
MGSSGPVPYRRCRNPLNSPSELTSSNFESSLTSSTMCAQTRFFAPPGPPCAFVADEPNSSRMILYHLTDAENLGGIAERGLVPVIGSEARQNRRAIVGLVIFVGRCYRHHRIGIWLCRQIGDELDALLLRHRPPTLTISHGSQNDSHPPARRCAQRFADVGSTRESAHRETTARTTRSLQD